MTYIAYLDEFGHIGPYMGRNHPTHKTSPVFGLAGLMLPLDEVRGFSTWFFQQKCRLLQWEIDEAGVHPAIWEKKGSQLYSVRNVERYVELRKFTNRFFNKIVKIGGFVFYVGFNKTEEPTELAANKRYTLILHEAIKRLNDYCTEEFELMQSFQMVMDEHQSRASLITEASKAMFNQNNPRKALIEPPFQVESERYQTVQAADWIAGLVGRLGAFWAEPEAYPENQIFRKYFEARLNQASIRSGIRNERNR